MLDDLLNKRIPVVCKITANEGGLIAEGKIDLANLEPGTTVANITLEDWGLLATGKSGWIEIERAWLREAQTIFELFCSKQHDYGPKNIGIAGLPGLATRAADKLSRWFELLEKGEAQNESLEDTLMDIADYGIIALLVLHGHWPRYTLADVDDNHVVIEAFMHQFGLSEQDLVDFLAAQ